jgi:hypothetical protein
MYIDTANLDTKFSSHFSTYSAQRLCDMVEIRQLKHDVTQRNHWFSVQTYLVEHLCAATRPPLAVVDKYRCEAVPLF